MKLTPKILAYIAELEQAARDASYVLHACVFADDGDFLYVKELAEKAELKLDAVLAQQDYKPIKD